MHYYSPCSHYTGINLRTTSESIWRLSQRRDEKKSRRRLSNAFRSDHFQSIREDKQQGGGKRGGCRLVPMRLHAHRFPLKCNGAVSAVFSGLFSRAFHGSGAFQNLTSRTGSGQEVFEISRVESNWIRKGTKSHRSGSVGSGRVGSGRVGSGRVGSGQTVPTPEF